MTRAKTREVVLVAAESLHFSPVVESGQRVLEGNVEEGQLLTTYFCLKEQ